MQSPKLAIRCALAALALCGLTAAARADGAQTGSASAPGAASLATAPTSLASAPATSATGFAPAAGGLPVFAQQPASDPWAGLSIGGGITVTGGGKGVRGGVGGDAYLAYNRELSNNLVIGVQAVSGYAPNIYRYSHVQGFDYAGAQATVGYDMGQFEPYVIAGVDFAKADFGPPGRYDTSDSLNNLFNKGGGPLLTATTVGAGFNYAINNRLSMGFSVTATQVNGGGPASAFLP